MTNLATQELTPGVLLVLEGICNRGIIQKGGRALVVDSGVGPAEAAPLRSLVESYVDGRQLFLCNTHAHGDHVYGNQVFADCPIIAHTDLRHEMVTSGAETLAGWRQNPRMAAWVDDVIVTPPTVVFTDMIGFFFEDLEVQLRYVGAAHSASDSVVWLPQSRTLFTGDLLFNAIVPAMPPGCNLVAWEHALDALIGLEPEHVVPGHGPVQSPAALADLRGWFARLHAQVGDAKAKGWDREAAVARVAASMQDLVPCGREERLPAAVGQAFDQFA